MEGALPYVYLRRDSDPDFPAWFRSHRDDVERRMLSSGAVLFRGFDLADHSLFSQLLDLMCRQVISGYGDLPPEKDSDRIYGSTPYRQDRSILFHNESSHLPSWPTRQFFCCVIAAAEGGATPIVDCRRIYARLPQPIRERFAAKGLLYVRHFIEGLDVSWQAFFKTEDRATVARICRARGAQVEWKANGSLMVAQPAQAVARHPITGEWSFFNQIMLHHPAFLRREERESLESLFGVDNMPRMVTYGDGTAIEADALAAIHELYEQHQTSFPWQKGDVLALENMTVAHARSPFKGPRKIIVGMGDPIEMYQSDATPAAALS